MPEWNNTLFDVMGQPGGFGLCIMTYILPCLTVKDISEFKEPGSGMMQMIIWILLAAIFPIECCIIDAPNRAFVAQKAGVDDPSGMMISIFCQGCSLCQVMNQVKKLQGNAPAQQTMS